MIIDILYGIKLPEKLINELKNNGVKEEIYSKFTKRYFGVPVDDRNEFFPSSEMYFDHDDICSMKPDQTKIKIKANKNTKERYEELLSNYLYILCEEDADKISSMVSHLHNTEPYIMFVAEDM